MPGFDRRGPMGSGPITGRGMGMCNPQFADRTEGRKPGFGNQPGLGMRRGNNRGYGGGFGFRGGSRQTFQAKENQADELSNVRNEVRSLKNTLGRLEERLAELTQSGASS
jgi:Family of unknown function (DUF5320)